MTWIYFLYLFLILTAQQAEKFSVWFDADNHTIVIEGFSEIEDKDISSRIAVYFGESIEPDQPQLIGAFKRAGKVIHYQAKYGFVPGKSYLIVLDHQHCGKKGKRGIVIIPTLQHKPSTFVTGVFPTTSKIPMNQLKFYIEFSAPMRIGNAYDHVKLYRLPERKLESEAFLASHDELWDPTNQRLTIFFDPGRIKRGVQPNLQLGLPLVEGRTYLLVIDEEWLDINGVKLIKGFEKHFEVIAVDRSSPNPEKWAISIPEEGSKNALSIEFKESMDYGLLHSAIVIKNTMGQITKGEIELRSHESQWLFHPFDHWKAGTYQIIINGWLEDLAGNNLRRKFDVDLNNPADKPKDLKEITIPFKIHSQPKLKN